MSVKTQFYGKLASLGAMLAAVAAWGDAGVPWAEHRLPVGGPALGYSFVLE